MKTQILTSMLLALSTASLTFNVAALNYQTFKDQINNMQPLCPETNPQERRSEKKLIIDQFNTALRRQNQQLLTQAIKNILEFELMSTTEIDETLSRAISKTGEDSKEWLAFLRTKLNRSTSPTTSSDGRKL